MSVKLVENGFEPEVEDEELLQVLSSEAVLYYLVSIRSRPLCRCSLTMPRTIARAPRKAELIKNAMSWNRGMMPSTKAIAVVPRYKKYLQGWNMSNADSVRIMNLDDAPKADGLYQPIVLE